VSPRGTRRNLLALGLDYGLFLVGLSFVSQATILPAFAAHLGAPNVVIGAIPAVMTAGWLLPALFAAAHTASLERRLPFVLRWTVWERAPFLVLAAAAFFLAERAPGATLAMLLAMLLLITGVGGILMPAWMDVVGRAVPTTLRGRFFGAGAVLGGLGGLGGSAVVTWVLARVAAPASFGVCFLLAALCMALSFVALALVHEPPVATPAPATPLRAYLTSVPALLRGDRNLSWFLLARGCAACGLMASGFFTVYALEAHGAETWRVGVFTSLILGGQVAGNLVLGWLADRAGHRLVIAIGVAATLAADVVALLAPSLGVFSAVFVLHGVHMGAINVSSLNILLEFAPREADRPTYIGLGTTVTGPIAVGAPLAAGLLADAAGFRAIFAAAAAFGAAALAVLLGRVRDPRAAVG